MSYKIALPPKQVFREVYGNVLEVDGKTIIPLQHPAAVLHDISIKSTLVKNYRKMQVLHKLLSKKRIARQETK